MTSRLAHQRSAYLRAAAAQPVDWHPWSQEAFGRARSEGKPILLDIGAAWCHWCHVMDHESYEDAAIAERLNRDWICIKVDRDERPDVDARYQRAVQALTGQGGWPLTAFLTPDGSVFFAGTYFPPSGAHGRPGFSVILDELARAYRQDRERIHQQAAQIREQLDSMASQEAAGPLTPSVLGVGEDAMARAFDFRHGGFGTQPKFPHPGACDFLLGRWFDTRNSWQREIVERTLTSMARGGIRDHLGGGFHRYSVDARWIVPHFEKMIYDNAELLRAYTHATAAFSAAPAAGATVPADEPVQHQGRLIYREIVEDIVRWITTTMARTGGGYYASQDADVGPGDDGDYFTWTADEVKAVTDHREFEVLSLRYGMDEVGEIPRDPSRNVLWTSRSIPQVAEATGFSRDEVERLLASGEERLAQARDRRPAPFVDETLYTAWNAMTASAMLAAGALLEREELERHALDTLELLFDQATDSDPEGGMRHAVGSPVGGLLDDQVHTAQAALDAYEATGNLIWLDRAASLMEHVWSRYRADGGLSDVLSGRGGEGYLSEPLIPIQDSPTPSPNGIAGIVLCRLAEHTGEGRWRARGHEHLETFAGGAGRLGVFGATVLSAIDWAVHPPAHVVIVADGSERVALLRAARTTFRPRKVIMTFESGAGADRLPEPLRAMVDGRRPRAYVCAGLECAPPVDSPGALAGTLASFGVEG